MKTVYEVEWTGEAYRVMKTDPYRKKVVGVFVDIYGAAREVYGLMSGEDEYRTLDQNGTPLKRLTRQELKEQLGI